MRGIFRKALSDLRGRPMQAVLLFVVVAAAAATLSLALNVQASASKPYERLREESNGADVWVTAYGENVDLRLLSQIEGVEEVGEPYPISWQNYGIRNGEKKQQIALVGLGAELPEFDHPVVTRGRWLGANGTNEIVVDAGAANILNLRIGQEISLLTPDGSRPFTVVGFAVTASRNPAPISDPAFAYVLPQTLHQIEPDAVFGASGQHSLRVGIRVDDPGLVFAAARQMGGPVGYDHWLNVREISKEANEFDIIFLDVFGLFALLAAGLIIANAIGGQVLSQLRDIGILKAIGFTPRQVTLSLLMQNLTLALAASLVGVFIGLLSAPFFLGRTADLLGVPATASFNPSLLLIAIAVVLALVSVFTIVPAWRAGRIRAIEALNAGNDSGPARPSRLAKLAARIGLPVVAVMGLKDLWRRPVRTFLTVLALVLAVVTATFSLGIEATFDKTMSDATVIGGPPYDIIADRDVYPDAQARAILEAHPDVEDYLAQYSEGGRIGNQGFDIRGYDGDLTGRRWPLREGRMPARAGEAAVSILFTTQYGVDVGDRVRFMMTSRDGPREVEVQVVGRYVDFEGEVMTVTRDMLPADAEPTDYLIEARPGADQRELANSLIDLSGGYLDPEVLSETLAGIRDDFRSVLVGLNTVLFCIAGVNLLSSLLLNIRERRRDFAILKTVGFTPGQVALAVFCGSVALAVLAVAAGLPLGLLATRAMFDVLSSAAGIGTGVGAMPGLLWLLPLVPGAVAVAVLATVLPARRAAGVEVAEVLRYE
jgi:putative ABC transport system permease protein